MKNLKIVYTKETEKFKNKLIMMVINEPPVGYEDYYRIVYYNALVPKELDRRQYYTVEELAIRLMEFIVHHKDTPKFFYDVFCSDELDSFVEYYLEGAIAQSPIDRLDIGITNKYSLTMRNVIGFYYDNGVLQIIDKNEILERRKCYTDISFTIKRSVKELEDEMIQRDLRLMRKYERDIRSYESADFWIIEAGVFNCFLSKEAEEHPFIQFYSDYRNRRKNLKIELKTWFEDDILEKIPYSRFLINAKSYRNQKLTQEAMDDLLMQKMQMYENLTARDKWKVVESYKYIAYYSLTKIFTYHIVNKETGKLVCFFCYC